MSIQSEQEGRIMGKATGFLEYERVENPGQEPLERIKTYREFHTPLNLEERQKQGARLSLIHI